DEHGGDSAGEVRVFGRVASEGGRTVRVAEHRNLERGGGKRGDPVRVDRREGGARAQGDRGAGERRGGVIRGHADRAGRDAGRGHDVRGRTGVPGGRHDDRARERGVVRRLHAHVGRCAEVGTEGHADHIHVVIDGPFDRGDDVL